MEAPMLVRDRVMGYRVAVLVTVTLCAAIYGLGLSGPFVFDDGPNITANAKLDINPAVLDDWRIAAASSGSGPLGRPLAMVSFAFNNVFFGSANAFGYKLVNVAIHLGTGFLLFLLSRLLFGFLQPAWDRQRIASASFIALAIWLLNPLHVSTTLYVVQRMTQLSALFCIAGLLVFAIYRVRWSHSGAQTGDLLACFAWCSIFTLLATLSKENGLLLPWLILVAEATLFRGKWDGRGIRSLRMVTLCAAVLPMLLMTVVYLLPPDYLLHMYASREFSLEQRMLTQLRVLWLYCQWFLVPTTSSMGFQHDDIILSSSVFSPFTTSLALVAWLVAWGASLYFRNKHPIFLFTVMFFIVGHALESTVWPLEMVYEHRNYLPSISLAILVAWIVAGPLWSVRRLYANVAVLFLLLVLALSLYVRVLTWSDELSLTGTNALNHPESPRSNFFYATTLWQRYNEAEQDGVALDVARDNLIAARYYFERAHRLDTHDLVPLIMLASIDKVYFPELYIKNDWLSKIDSLLVDDVLQPSDYNGLVALADCRISGGCIFDRDRILAIYDKASRRYPESHKLLVSRLKLYQFYGLNSSSLNQKIREQISSGATSIILYDSQLRHHAEGGNIGELYNLSRLLLKNDASRRNVKMVKDFFASPGIDDG
jgi:protein O-mannosyl-transferase